MKRLIASIALVCLGWLSYSQENESNYGYTKGDVFLTGNVGFNSVSQDEIKANRFNFTPSLGYFFNEHISGELGIIIGSYTLKDGDFETKGSSFGGAIGADYWFTPEQRFSFLLGLDLTYVSSTFKPDSNIDYKITDFLIAFAPGINYFISQNFSLFSSIGVVSYSSTDDERSSGGNINSFTIDLGLSNVNIGVSYRF